MKQSKEFKPERHTKSDAATEEILKLYFGIFLFLTAMLGVSIIVLKLLS